MFSSGVNKLVILAKETTWGVAPASTGGTLYPRVTLDLNHVRAQFSSNRINATAQVQDLRSGTDSAEGTLSDELSAGSHTALWAALLRGPWVTGVTQTLTTVAASSVGNTLTRSAGDWIANGFKVGDIIDVTGFATPANTLRSTCITALTATVMTVSNTLVTEAAGASVTVATQGSKLVIPKTPATRTDDSFTIEQYFSEIGVSRIATGVKVSSADIKISPDAMSTVDFKLMGAGMTTSASQYFTTPTAAIASSVMSGNKATFYVGGVAVAIATSLDLTIDSGMEAGKVIGNQKADGTRPLAAIFLGTIKVTGKMSLYFSDDSLYTAFKNETNGTLVYQAIGDNGREIIIKLPAVRYGAPSLDDKSVGGLIQSIDFTAIYDQSAASNQDQSSIVIQEILA